MRCLSRILLYTLLSSPAARAGPLSRSERLQRAYLDTSEEEAIALAVRQEVDDGTTPTPIFSTIVPDAPESGPSPPPSSETAGNEDACREDDGSSTTSTEASPLSSQAPELVTTSSDQNELPSTTSPDAAETETEAPVPSSEQAFLPPISSRISVPASLRSSQATEDPSSLIEPSSATPDVTPSTVVTESQTREIPLESSTEANGAPSDNGGSLTPTPIFSTLSAGPTTTEALSFASTLLLPIGERSTTVTKSEAASSTVADEPPTPSASIPSIESSTLIIQSSQPQPSTPVTESLLSSTLAPDNSNGPAASTTRSITDRPLFTTTVGIPSASEVSSSIELTPSSSPVEETLPVASSALPAFTNTPASTTVTAPEITPTGEPDLQVPTNRGPPNPSATSSISPERFQANLEQARAFHESFKPLTEQSACFGQQAACINGGIAQCQPGRGHFVITACNDGNEECFPLPLVFEDGVKLSCTDPIEARRILDVEDDDSSPVTSATPSGEQVVTVTEQPTVTEIVATETVGTETFDNGTPSPPTSRPQSPSATPPAEGVVTVTETPTVTLVVTETVDQPGTEETSAPPLEVTTTIGGGILTLTTFITVQPPLPEPTEPSTTQFITVTITALPSSPPETQTEVIEVPQPTSSARPGPGGGSGGEVDDGRGDDGRGDENDSDGNDGDDENNDGDGDDPVLTSLNIIIIPTTLLTTTIRATPAAEQALATPVDDAAPTVTTTVTEIVSVPVLVTVTQREVRIEQATVTATVTQAA